MGEDAAAHTRRDGAVLETHEDAFHLLADGPTGNTLIGSVRVEGDTLVLETNSERRIEELQQLVLTTDARSPRGMGPDRLRALAGPGGLTSARRTCTGTSSPATRSNIG